MFSSAFFSSAFLKPVYKLLTQKAALLETETSLEAAANQKSPSKNLLVLLQ
jgi:hypothetical protein